MPSSFSWANARLESRRHLPHLRQDDSVYFVTFRLADSVAEEELERIKQQCSDIVVLGQRDEERRLEMRRRLERYLDRGAGECILGRAEIGQIVADAVTHFDGERYLLDAYVVMPNHVHALVWPAKGYTLTHILHSWKSYTSSEINRRLGREGQLWQSESFDHIVRDTQSLIRFRSYIKSNPKKLLPGRYVLGEGKFREVMGY